MPVKHNFYNITLPYPEFNTFLAFLSNKKHASMAVISRKYHFGADKAVQISWVLFVDKGTQPKLRQKKQNRLIKQDIRFSLCFALLVPNFLKISILLYTLYAHTTGKMCLEGLTLKMAIKV